jgi:hypothetical protein
MIEEIGARLEHLSCKSLTLLSALQAQVLMTVVWRTTRKSHLLPHKMRYIQAFEEAVIREDIF